MGGGVWAAGSGLAFFALVLSVVRAVNVPAGVPREGTAETIGRVLFGQYLLPFELTSFLLLAAVVSIVVLAKKTS